MERVRVENVRLVDGKIYTGSAIMIGGETIPDGYGISKFENGRAVGSFKAGVLDGPAYFVWENFRDSSMTMGVFTQQRLNGWGINMTNGRFRFGVFKDSKMIVDLSHEVEWMMDEIRKSNNKRWAYVYPKAKEVFLGNPGTISDSNGISGAYRGFHFFDNGDLYVGQMYNFIKTGNFIKYGNDGSVVVGEWENGKSTKVFTIQDLFDIHFGEYDPDDLFYKGGLAGYMDKRKELKNIVVDTSTRYFSSSSNDISKNELKDIIEFFKTAKKELEEYDEIYEDSERSFDLNPYFDLFMAPLLYAWGKLGYGHHSDFWEEGDSMFEFMMFAAQPKSRILQVIDAWNVESPALIFGSDSGMLIKKVELIFAKIKNGEI